MKNYFNNWITLTEAADILECTVQNASLAANKDKFKILRNKKGRIVLVNKDDVRKHKKTVRLGRPPNKRRPPARSRPTKQFEAD
jgi:hypothetical protein